jgi:Na+-driven multidrug efflux pump
VRASGIPAFRLIAFAQPFIGVSIIYMNALRGAGDTRWPMLFSLICGVGIRVPLAYLGAIVLEGGLIGAWCGMWGDNLVRAVLAGIRFTLGGWQKTRV